MFAIFRNTLNTAPSAKLAIAAAQHLTRAGFIHSHHTKPDRQPTSYYHLREGEGLGVGVYTSPKSVPHSEGVKQEINAIMTHGSATCICVYVPLTSTRCFAAQLKAWIHAPRGDNRNIWCPGPDEGKALTQSVPEKLEKSIGQEPLSHGDNERARESLVVCPWQVFFNEEPTGSYMLDGVQRFFKLGDEVRKHHEAESKRAYGFGVKSSEA